MKSQSNSLILVGYCPYPHGIQGALSFFPASKEDSILTSGMEIFLKKSKEAVENYQRYEIKKITKGNKWIIYLDGQDNRNAADLLTPCEVYCERTAFPVLNNKNQYYLADLIGLRVYSYDTGEVLGRCTGHYHNGAQYVLVLELQNETVELPFIDYFFPEIDLTNGEMRVRRPEVVSE